MSGGSKSNRTPDVSSGNTPGNTSGQIDSVHAQQLGQWLVNYLQTHGGATASSTPSSLSESWYSQLGVQTYQYCVQYFQTGNFPPEMVNQLQNLPGGSAGTTSTPDAPRSN